MLRHLLALSLLFAPLAWSQTPALSSTPDPNSARRALPLDVEPDPLPLTAAATAIEWDERGRPTGEDAVRLQIFLDQEMFGPGVIDGKPGRFTELAVQSWNEARGHPQDDWRPVSLAARQAVPNAFAVAVVPEVAGEWVDPSLPTSRAEQAKRRRMSYRSIAEFMSERYHCDVPYLRELNPGKNLNTLRARDTLVVPNVEPFRIEDLDGRTYEAEEGLSQRLAVVDTRVNQVRIFEATRAAIAVREGPDGTITVPLQPNRALIASFPITPGQPRFVPVGTWELRNAVEMPWWRYDQQFLDTGRRSDNALNIPPGPNSPVGIIWMGLNRSGIGLHGTSDPETIGRSRSAGCVRLANWDAIRLPKLIRPGATVEIR